MCSKTKLFKVNYMSSVFLRCGCCFLFESGDKILMVNMPFCDVILQMLAS